jgi:hypothetical protein
MRDRIRPITHPEPSEATAAGEAPAAAAPGVPGSDSAANASPPAGSDGAAGAPAAATAPGPTRAALVARYPELTGPPLPELVVKSFGLHLGGGNKDEETRGAYLRQLEHGFPDYLECYRELDTPGKEGTFGADLRIDAQGGRPRVEQTRTKLPGDDFKQCMVRSIEALRFKAPPSGRALMISYSVKFSWR